MMEYLRAMFVMLGVQVVVLLIVMAKVSEIVNYIKGKGAKL